MSSTFPKLSIITINLNNSEGLRLTIESIVAQQRKEFEFIVIDGSSTDGSVDVIHEFSDHIDYWVSEPDSGIYNAMNKGIAVATGEYCLFLNSGDTLLPDSLSSSLFDDIYADIIYFPCYMMYNNGTHVLRTFPDKLSSLFFFMNSINHQSTFIKRTCFNQLGFYNESYRHLADFDFWIRSIVLDNCPHHYIPNAITSYDMHGITGKWNDQLSAERDAILKKHFPPLVYEDLVAASKIRHLIQASKAATLPFRIAYFFFRITNYISHRISTKAL